MVTYIHTCIHTHIHTWLHTYTHGYIHTCIHTHIHTWLHTYTHGYIHTHMHTYTHIYMVTYIHGYIHTHMHTHIHSYILYIHAFCAYRTCSKCPGMVPKRSWNTSCCTQYARGRGFKWVSKVEMWGWKLYTYLHTRTVLFFNFHCCHRIAYHLNRMLLPITRWFCIWVMMNIRMKPRIRKHVGRLLLQAFSRKKLGWPSLFVGYFLYLGVFSTRDTIKTMPPYSDWAHFRRMSTVFSTVSIKDGQ